MRYGVKVMRYGGKTWREKNNKNTYKELIIKIKLYIKVIRVFKGVAIRGEKGVVIRGVNTI